MKKIFAWAMAAALICGTGTFTACTTDNGDNPSEQAKKNRTEFVQHARQNLKTVASNLNFTTWNSINYFNKYLNQYVLLNDNFDKTITRTLIQEVRNTITPLPAEAAERYGKKYSATINLADFDYIFTSTQTGFDVTPNTEDGLIVEITNPYMPEMSVRISLKGSGEEYDLIAERLSNDSVGVVIKVPAHYDFSFSTKQNGQWVENISVCTQLTVAKGQYDDPNLPADAADVRKDTWSLKGTIKSSVPGDAVEAAFNIGQDPKTHKASMALDYAHNGLKIVGLSAEMTMPTG